MTDVSSRAPSSTLLERIESAAATSGSITFVGAADPVRVSWRELHDDARAMAAGLHQRDVGPGSHVALLGMTSRAFVTAIQATWLAGATVVVLPLPMRLGSVEEFVAQTRARIRSADTDLLVMDADLAAFVDPAPGDPPIALLHQLAAAGSSDRYERPAVAPADLAVLQFTSGSTADPKGVMLPHAQICANLDGMATAARMVVGEDRMVSWLPLYHDMGLLGLLTLPMTSGTDLVQAAPQDFLAAPARWMQWMHEYRATATAGPNFSYALAARALNRMDTLDLSRWRIALNGAEPVDPDGVEVFCAAGARHGLRPGAVFAAFGMAEATLGVTFPEPMAGLQVDVVDRNTLETERYAAAVDRDGREGARTLAKLGRPVPGIEIRVVDPATGDEMGDREAGELEIRGTSVTPGYYKHPQATANTFHDGWLRTGDLAYTVDGELVVCGRLKDVIIVGGRNVFPEDVERAVAQVEGVRAGNVIAFGVEGRKGREALVVVAETKADDASPIRQAVAQRVRQAIGISPEEVVLVAAGSLPKTSSGKLQRSLCRTRYLEAELA